MSVLAIAGRGQLGAPPVLHPGNLVSWWSSEDPVAGAVSLARVGGLLTGFYWLLLCGVTLAARVTGRTAWLMRLRLPGLGRLLRKAAGASVVGAAVAGAAGCGVVAAGHPVAGHPVAGHPVAGNQVEGRSVVGRSVVGRAPTPPVLVPAGLAPVTLAPVPATPAPATGPTAEPARPSPTTWVVSPGDDLWSISASILERRLGRQPDDRAVAALWLQVVELNRPNLPDPSNPSLIFAGEVVAIPG